MTYRETINYLDSFINYEKISVWKYKESLELDSFRDFLASIGNPQDSFLSIHVAGSKGKGSTCAFISYILREAGYAAGLYTSPHLVDFRERIRILRPAQAKVKDCREAQCFEGKIPVESLMGLVKELKPSIETHNKKSKYGPLTFFEVYTALAFLYFKRENVDFAVIETGLGGRLDATNVVNSLVCVITPISYEHTQKLGNTLRKIATEKAGIIKRVIGSGKPAAGRCSPVVISAPQEDDAEAVIKNRCKKVNAQIFSVGKDIICKRTKDGFNVKSILKEYPGLKIKLLGNHQLVNASAAIGAIEVLRLFGFDVDIECVRQGLYNTSWPGRFEIISQRPAIVLDGAQNKASAQVLKKAVKENFSAGGMGRKYKRLILVLGISCDKDIKGICGEICSLADRIILTEANNPRAAGVEIIEKIIRGLRLGPEAGVMIVKTKNVRDALSKAKEIARKKDLILVTGSLFVVGEVRNLCKM